MKRLFFFLYMMAWANMLPAQTSPDTHYMLIGTYTSGKSEGVYLYRFNSKDGSFSYVHTYKGLSNPSYLAMTPDHKAFYALDETTGQTQTTSEGFSVTEISLDSIFGTGNGWRYKKKITASGYGTCYIAVDKTGKWLTVATYRSGTITVIPVNKDGSMGDPVQVIQHVGKSINAQRQETAHVHATVFSPDNRYLFVPDLGIDKVMIYRFDEKTGKLTQSDPAYVESTPGAGPRHMEFHPNGKYVYVIEELAGTVSAYDYNGKGKLTAIQNISSHPAGYKGVIGSADIHVSPDGKFLYASNRGESNTIAIFSINEKDGKLMPEGHQSTLGIKPRNFNFDPTGNFLLVANQDSNNIVIFKIDKKTGLLTALPQQIEIPNPVCIKWVK